MLPAIAWALTSDREQPISIEADHAQLDDKTGVTQYKGNAILTQGTLKIEGDIITFYYGEDKQITKAVAQGKRAKYQQVHKPGEKPVKAKALQMEYRAKEQKIYLLGDAHIWQNGNESTGNSIEYDITRDLVNISSADVKIGDKVEKSNKRIHIIIQPPGKNKKPKQSTSQQKQPQAEPALKAPTEAIDKPQSTAPDSTERKYKTAATTTRLNIRTGPGTQYSKLGTFNSETNVIVLSIQEYWSQVRGEVDGQPVIGWVNNRYLVQN
jgi:lipopolysaccharide export system protein LptA